ncbi:hypothetical protein EPUS_06101 [Endocarpon pusillum Z07020]|uniref:Uncharacterized protein n=1 Tax=Endocarpon pusillum (strain Z07020 / HMAS-L-300199) TaxID=1263415 RepID=U1HPM3_ENDPU|nr:uncharacterized protein EPUS_06101 [Endocarpon pusillum Z07020]ERF72345.1 hypothetical protein EPUS_06101 [Endocarpon pusillum Z07020]
MSPHQRTPHHSRCKAKRLLLRDIRPTPNSRNQSLLRKSDLCPKQCIYCDIWKLALLVYSRQAQPTSKPNTPTTPSFPTRQQSQSYYSPRPSPTSPYPPNDHQQALRAVEAGHTLQRAQLSSILSICTVEGAEESEGLRIAHDRCLGAVLELVRRERAIRREMSQEEEREEQEEQDRRERESRQREAMLKRERERREREFEYRYAGESCGYGSLRRGSGGVVVSCAM